MERPLFISRTHLREMLSTNEIPISFPAIKKWEEEGKIPEAKKFGNTAVYSISELSEMIGEDKEDIWQFLHDIKQRENVA